MMADVCAVCLGFPFAGLVGLPAVRQEGWVVPFAPPVGAVAASEQGEVEALDTVQTPLRERRIPAR